MFVLVVQALLFSVLGGQAGSEELHIELRTLSEVKACFHADDSASTKRGFCVRSTPLSMHVRTLRDEVFLGQEKKSTHASLQLGQETFIKYNTAIDQLHRLTSRSSIEDGGETEEVKKGDLERAVRRVLEHEDIDLLEKMARALGSAGLYGHENPSILPFYATAKRYSGLAKDLRRKRKKRDIWTKMTTDPEESETEEEYVDRMNAEMPMSNEIDTVQNELKTNGASESSEPQPPTKTPNTQAPTTQNLFPGYDSACPPNPQKMCLGLCGYGCDCWKFLCGDCCWHKGCYHHDLCCRKSLFTFACLMPFTFSCDKDYSSFPSCVAD